VCDRRDTATRSATRPAPHPWVGGLAEPAAGAATGVLSGDPHRRASSLITVPRRFFPVNQLSTGTCSGGRALPSSRLWPGLPPGRGYGPSAGSCGLSCSFSRSSVALLARMTPQASWVAVQLPDSSRSICQYGKSRRSSYTSRAATAASRSSRFMAYRPSFLNAPDLRPTLPPCRYLPVSLFSGVAGPAGLALSCLAPRRFPCRSYGRLSCQFKGRLQRLTLPFNGPIQHYPPPGRTALNG
jgi:hypothetical protein